MNDRKTRIGFVCSGNLCRSPFAEGYMRKVASEEGWTDHVEFVSAGTLDLDDVPVHETTMELASEIGVNLVLHRSQPANREFVEACDMVLGMDREHVTLLRGLFPEFEERVYLLGAFPEIEIDENDPSVPDPIGKKEAVFRECHAAIVGQLQPLIEELRTLYQG